jgi:hypothetical protein
VLELGGSWKALPSSFGDSSVAQPSGVVTASSNSAPPGVRTYSDLKYVRSFSSEMSGVADPLDLKRHRVLVVICLHVPREVVDGARAEPSCASATDSVA